MRRVARPIGAAGAADALDAANGRALGIEVIGASKSFGAFRALDQVSLKIAPGSVHALLGENGAGKSTLVKGLVGYGPLDAGQIIAGTREVRIASPRDAQALDIGMVYQHFTLAAGMSVEENLLLARAALPWRIDWRAERGRLERFLARMPFQLRLDAPVSSLAAGEKQKLEILKQLYLERRFLILDEPTSVLTPQEADEVLGLMRELASARVLTVLMITHKFREVLDFADAVTVLRKGRAVAQANVADTSRDELAAWMMGVETVARDATTNATNATTSASASAAKNSATGATMIATTGAVTSATSSPAASLPDTALAARATRRPCAADAPIGLEASGLTVRDDLGLPAVRELSLAVRRGEILGIAGVSGNGQKALVEALIGQRQPAAGRMAVGGRPYRATREEMRERRVFAIPEEPLRNACIASMSVAENLALRDFDRAPLRSQGWRLDRRALRRRAAERIAEFKVSPPLPERAIGTLSGGNVQRAVLARELGQPVEVLIVANPVFGLDFASVADIHARLLAAREAGAAILLVSEDLDELLALSDRIAVMSAGRLVFETEAAGADRAVLGRYMAGHDEADEPAASSGRPGAAHAHREPARPADAPGTHR
ncbi:ABC transporter ATP-binding protein [Burkholderia gladioli]|uniref:ABC transporter ATP-binding protein n=1 Tax=Burkholderia gladioli TaxID=28095 RepID=A0A2A7S278_BURGA|nr:ATP-binding cassette domain-containing protein [Burkholderia gladioli]MBU9194739.1 ATP-binding cassette domain-containing protein [Burkholderia gladioli]MBU9421812.1 ATP-binding cassette domain-containing protein [Burkholderia gladioli]MDN7922675.1 ATP-binding cassette domain-containing protein [Burkholderia gladioli]MDN8060531.1 ATP-binding cassette domain-containing protein [Burkholderia gladioli]PEH37681.1 ABC transporter ATP-binding protein [Burkholderia gladioli]